MRAEFVVVISNSCQHIRQTFIRWRGFIKPHFHQQACWQAGSFLAGEVKNCECLLERCMTVEVWAPHMSMRGDAVNVL